PPAGFVSPMTWGVESHVVERFTAAGAAKEKISFQRDTYTFHYSGPSSEFAAAFRDYYGPTMNAFEAAEKEGRKESLQKEPNDLFAKHNTSGSSGKTSIPATFLRVMVAR